MVEVLASIDEKFFLPLNGAHLPWLDEPFKLISGKLIWAPFYAWILWILSVKQRVGLWVTLLCIVLMIVVTDQGSGVIKRLVMRLRPTHEPGIMDLVHTVNNYRGGRFGFFSAHASNAFALAVFVSRAIKSHRFTATMFVWATVVSYSRIYLGVHYPGDILVGMLFGCAVGWFFYWFASKTTPFFCARLKGRSLRERVFFRTLSKQI